MNTNRNPILSFALSILAMLLLITLVAPPAQFLAGVICLAVLPFVARPWPPSNRLFRFARRHVRTGRHGGFAIALGLFLVLALIAVPGPAQAQVIPTRLNAATNLPATVAASTVSNQLSFISIPNNGKGLSLQWKFNASAGTANGTIWFAPSIDGTNVSTNNIWPLVTAAQVTTDVIATTNWSGQTLAGYSSLCIFAISNAAAAATITNKGITWNVHPN